MFSAIYFKLVFIFKLMKGTISIIIFFLSVQLFAQNSSNHLNLTNDSIIYCPTETEINNLELLRDCCCLKEDNCQKKASETGLKIIRKGYEMSVITKKIIKGSCWNFANAVYNDAGFPSEKREIIFKGTKKGPFADIDIIQPGDWIYHINYSFHGVEHSAIFICWKDYEKKIAITLGHVGQNLARSGIYGEYDLKSVYYITRAKN